MSAPLGNPVAGSDPARVAPAGELREDPLTGLQVVVAPGRGKRPIRPDVASRSHEETPTYDPSCPFCPGNEARLSSILAEREGTPDEPWGVRAVENRYPAFAPGGDGPYGGAAGAAPARGHQEVIVESPRHDLDLVGMTRDRLRSVVGAYHDRYGTVARSGEWARIFLFRNHGAAAGSSLPHPHAQIVAVGSEPAEVTRRDARLQALHDRRGRCPVCDLDDLEPEPAVRRVLETGRYRVTVPWAATAPCHMRIVPRDHAPHLHQARALDELTDAPSGALAAMEGVLGPTPYNLLLRGAPLTGDVDAFHWFLELRPRVGQIAGFELATGAFINPSSPEADAKRLRRALEARVPADPDPAPPTAGSP